MNNGYQYGVEESNPSMEYMEMKRVVFSIDSRLATSSEYNPYQNSVVEYAVANQSIPIEELHKKNALRKNAETEHDVSDKLQQAIAGKERNNGEIRANMPIFGGLESEKCEVCGHWTDGFHYGVLTCLGCKAFFRRNKATPPAGRCVKQGKCEITVKTRRDCQPCRFKKCLEVGMTGNGRETRETKIARMKILEEYSEGSSKVPTEENNPLNVGNPKKNEMYKEPELPQQPPDHLPDAGNYVQTGTLREDPVSMTNTVTRTENLILTLEKEPHSEDETINVDKTTNGQKKLKFSGLSYHHPMTQKEPRLTKVQILGIQTRIRRNQASKNLTVEERKKLAEEEFEICMRKMQAPEPDLSDEFGVFAEMEKEVMENLKKAIDHLVELRMRAAEDDSEDDEALDVQQMTEKNKRNGAAQKARYHKMNPEERCNFNRTKKSKNLIDKNQKEKEMLDGKPQEHFDDYPDEYSQSVEIEESTTEDNDLTESSEVDMNQHLQEKCLDNVKDFGRKRKANDFSDSPTSIRVEVSISGVDKAQHSEDKQVHNEEELVENTLANHNVPNKELKNIDVDNEEKLEKRKGKKEMTTEERRIHHNEKNRRRYHNMPADKKQAYNKRNTEIKRKLRLDKDPRAIARRKKDNEAYKAKYQKMTPEQRRIYNRERKNKRKINYEKRNGFTFEKEKEMFNEKPQELINGHLDEQRQSEETEQIGPQGNNQTDFMNNPSEVDMGQHLQEECLDNVKDLGRKRKAEDSLRIFAQTENPVKRQPKESEINRASSEILVEALHFSEGSLKVPTEELHENNSLNVGNHLPDAGNYEQTDTLREDPVSMTNTVTRTENLISTLEKELHSEDKTINVDKMNEQKELNSPYLEYYRRKRQDKQNLLGEKLKKFDEEKELERKKKRNATEKVYRERKKQNGVKSWYQRLSPDQKQLYFQRRKLHDSQKHDSQKRLQIKQEKKKLSENKRIERKERNNAAQRAKYHRMNPEEKRIFNRERRLKQLMKKNQKKKEMLNGKPQDLIDDNPEKKQDNHLTEDGEKELHDYENSNISSEEPDCMPDTPTSSKVEDCISGTNKEQDSEDKQEDNEDPLGVFATLETSAEAPQLSEGSNQMDELYFSDDEALLAFADLNPHLFPPMEEEAHPLTQTEGDLQNSKNQDDTPQEFIDHHRDVANHENADDYLEEPDYIADTPTSNTVEDHNSAVNGEQPAEDKNVDREKEIDTTGEGETFHGVNKNVQHQEAPEEQTIAAYFGLKRKIGYQLRMKKPITKGTDGKNSLTDNRREEQHDPLDPHEAFAGMEKEVHHPDKQEDNHLTDGRTLQLHEEPSKVTTSDEQLSTISTLPDALNTKIERRKAAQRARHARMTPERKHAMYEKQNAAKRAKYQAMTPEQRRDRNRKNKKKPIMKNEDGKNNVCNVGIQDEEMLKKFEKTQDPIDDHPDEYSQSVEIEESQNKYLTDDGSQKQQHEESSKLASNDQLLSKPTIQAVSDVPEKLQQSIAMKQNNPAMIEAPNQESQEQAAPNKFKLCSFFPLSISCD